MNRRKHPLASFSPPAPPPELRRKTLSAAEAAWNSEADDVRASRVRFTPWDWAWAAGLALLLLGNLFAGGRTRKSVAPCAITNREKAEAAELALLGIILPDHSRRPQRSPIPPDMEELTGAAGADF